ncbi:ATP-binding protein [Saccharopolyspora shandongensis]|uniref:ATP-binding protein n=1 Tax=Saccharopolyspora shandongensis TaxID=418495 RepID=UPI0033C34C6D
MHGTADRLVVAGGARNEVSGSVGTVVQAGTIVGDVHFQTSPSFPVPQQLPPAPGGFVGRSEQLEELSAGFSEQSGTSQAGSSITLVCGTAGVGKTALAVHWAHQVSADFPDGQLYVDLRGYGPNRPLDPGEVLAGFLRALGMPAEEIPDALTERAALYRSLLAGRRVLVVLDNACAENQVRPLLPGSSSCRALVTSRRVLSGLIVSEGAALVRVDLLTAAAALELFRTLVGARVDEEPAAADSVIRSCTRLPLALRVAGQAARLRPSMSLAHLAADLRDREIQLDVLGDGDPSTSARTVFSWSYEQLSGDAARAFRALGVYPGHDFDAYALAALLNITSRAAGRAIDSLVRAHLVQDPGSGRFDVHDLLRSYAEEIAEQHDSDHDRRSAVHRLFDYYLHTADKADRVITPHRYRIPLEGVVRASPVFDDHDDALAWLNTERPNTTAIFRVADPVLDSRMWQLAYTLRGYYFLSKQWKDWTETHELALESTQRNGHRYAEAQTRNNLGLALLEQGQLDAAADHYEKARKLFESVGDIHGVSNALANRAGVLHHLGDNESALQELERALACYEQTGARRNAAITLRRMARIEIDLRRFDAAVLRLGRALDLFGDLGLPLDAAAAFNCLGEAHHQVGNQVEAKQAHEKAVALSNECGSRFEYARAHHGLGRIAARRGRILEAEEHWEEAFARYTALGAPEVRQLNDERTTLQKTSVPRQRSESPRQNPGSRTE